MKNKNMKVQATKTMKDFLNMHLNDIGRFSYIKMRPAAYAHTVNAAGWYENSNDVIFDRNGREFYRVIILEYPPECYAPPAYISSNDLLKVFKHSNKTAAGFINEMRAAYEV